MPSPTDSTWPTSVTSASAPKFSICCFRMAEISAARMSIEDLFSFERFRLSGGAALAGLAHRETDGVELGAQGGVDHAAADANHEATDQRRIDLHVQVDLGLGDVAERRSDLAEHPLGGLLREPHLGLDDALRLGDEGAEAPDHVGQREQPPVPCDEADEVL